MFLLLASTLESSSPVGPWVPDALSGPPVRARSPELSEKPKPIAWDEVLWFDRGGDDERRSFVPAADCLVVPCVISEDGAIRFNRVPERDLRVEFWLVHARSVTRIEYFEKRTREDYLMLERALNLNRNRPVWSLSKRLESGDFDTLYVSGITRQYRLREGDLIVAEVHDAGDPGTRFTAYFRFHRQGFRLKLDFGLVVPINAIRVPKPTPDWESGVLGAAATLQLRRAKDPEEEYSALGNLWLSVHPTLFMGLTVRDFEQPGRIPEDQTQSDVFAGVGLTFFDFFFVGWGSNLLNAPRFSQPFIGVHLRKAVEYVAELDRSSPERWDAYMEREKEREIITP
ncbi:MAG: hypothetical protein AAFQ82_10860 [Myxococcota bacterium]